MQLTMHPVYKAQLLTYLKLAEKCKGFLINFNSEKISDQLVSLVTENYSILPARFCTLTCKNEAHCATCRNTHLKYSFIQLYLSFHIQLHVLHASIFNIFSQSYSALFLSI